MQWRLQIFNPPHYGVRNAYVNFQDVLGTCYGTDMRNAYTVFEAPSRLFEITIEHYTSNHNNFGIRRYWKFDFNHNDVKDPKMLYGGFLDPIKKNPQFQFRIQYGVLTSNPSTSRINPVQRNVFYSISLCTKESYCN